MGNSHDSRKYFCPQIDRRYNLLVSIEDKQQRQLRMFCPPRKIGSNKNQIYPFKRILRIEYSGNVEVSQDLFAMREDHHPLYF